jgi:modulator of FtsH protease
MTEPLAAWHDFNISVVTASAALLGLLFVALSLHIRTLMAKRNAELRSVARSVFLGYVVALGTGFLALVPQDVGPFGYELLVLVVLATIPFAGAARAGLRATGVGYDRRVTIVQFIAGIGLFAITIASALTLAAGDERALFLVGGIEVLSLLWGVFNTYELIFRVQRGEGEGA